MVVATVRALGVDALVSRVAKLMSAGVPQLKAVEKVLEDAELSDDAQVTLLRRGLSSYVDGVRAGQAHGREPVTRFRGGGQVAPGKRSEWVTYEAKFPQLTRSTYINSEGVMATLFEFTALDWRSLVDANETQRKNAAARVHVGKQALAMLRTRRVERTSDLPEKDLAALEVAVAEAWRR